MTLPTLTPRHLLLPVLLAMLAAACSGPGDDGDAPEARISEVRAARIALGEPAADLARSAGAVTDAVEGLRADASLRPHRRLEAVTEVRDDLLTELDSALAAAEEVEVAGETADAAAARDAWVDLVAAADLRAAAEEELDAIERAAALEVQLAELAAGWDESGSRSQQITRFIELEEEADALAADIEDQQSDVAECLTTFERRHDAAVTVAERTDELRLLVERYRGDEFDELRSEYRQDPYGLGARLTELDAAEVDCWRRESPLVAASEAMDTALERLEQSLNPEDL